MTTEDVRIPQMGEGLTEVRIVELHKQPGDAIHRDEIIYSMETDKAVLEVESPIEGTLDSWLAKVDQVLPIGAPIVRIRTNGANASQSGTAPTTEPKLEAPSPASNATETRIPPRSRAYAKQVGLTDEDLRSVPASTNTLSTDDIDRFLASRADSSYDERPLSAQQRAFIYRLKRSAQLVVPAVIMRPVGWETIRRISVDYKGRKDSLSPSEFQLFAFAVAQAVKPHPRFRSTLVGEEAVREHKHLNLGIAVGKPDGHLNTAMVANADTLNLSTFVTTARNNIRAARDGADQATEVTQLLLTYMGGYDTYNAIPVLVAPAVAVLFIGTPFEQNGQLVANLTLTFDHRLIQGVEAALFLTTVADLIGQDSTFRRD